jgi:hypothetical protein
VGRAADRNRGVRHAGDRHAADGQAGGAAESAGLAAAMLELSGAEANLEAMSAASRARHAERFTLQRMLSESASLHEDVLSAPS